MGLLKWVVGILAISAGALLATEKAPELSFAILVGLVVSYLGSKLVGGRPGSGLAWNSPSSSSVFKEDPRQVNASVYELHTPVGVPAMQVIFFHGFPFGDISRAHLSTWESADGSCYWPQTWLGKHFPDAQILVVSYYECLAKGFAEHLDMYNISENLISNLLQANIGQRPYCPVILVGHSFGGLVIKKICLQAHHKQNSKIDGAKAKRFLDGVRGIFYYATPHQGSRHIARVAFDLDSPLIKYFAVLSTDVSRLNYQFNHLWESYPKWQVGGLGESLPVKSGPFRGKLVVPEASAREGDTFCVDERADHFSISKPDNEASRRFTALTDLLHNIANNLKEEIKTRNELCQQEEARAREDAQPRNLQQLPKQIVGTDFRVKQVQSKLQNVTMLGLVGMGGVGKTTLAMAMFNEWSPTFEYSCFVPEVKLIKGNVDEVKEAVWKHMHWHGRKVEEKDDWFTLRGKRLLLVLDDISDDRDVAILSNIADHSSLESRFIATSRDRELLNKLEGIYEVPFLDEKDSKELFMSCAFPRDAIIPPGLASVMAAVVKKCGGLPLTLEVLGSYLKTKKDDKYWEQTLQALDKAEAVSDLNKRLWEKLRLSYDGLQEKEQQMFLDATTFFNGSWFLLGDAKAAWRKAYGTDSESLFWQTLVDRCLVDDVRENEHIKVHEQLRSLGKKIAMESSNNGCCRVWEKPMALRLLQTTDQVDNKELYSLQLKESYDRIHITSEALHKLKKIRFLEIDAPLVIDGCQENDSSLNELVLLKCVGFHFFNLALQSRLVGVHLSTLDVEFLPNSIGQLSSLRVFVLCGASLENLPNEIGHLSQLEHLEFRDCSCLQNLPESFGLLSALTKLSFSHCPSLESLPESFGQLVALNKLSFFYCRSLESLPESFGQLLALNELSFFECDSLESLPESFGQLSTLNNLEFMWCKRLESLPKSFGQLSALNELSFFECDSLESLPESFGQLSTLNDLEFMWCKRLESLPKSFGQLSALNELSFFECDSLESLPESFGQLSTLNKLSFKSCQFEKFARVIWAIVDLERSRVHVV